VAERVKCLLLMLSDPGKTVTRPTWRSLVRCSLPTPLGGLGARDRVAVLGSLRRLDVLHDRKPKSVSFNRIDLGQTKSLPGMTSSSLPVCRDGPLHSAGTSPLGAA
jgi:hypothetical protein